MKKLVAHWISIVLKLYCRLFVAPKLSVEWNPNTHLGNWHKTYTLKNGKQADLRNCGQIKLDLPFTIFQQAWEGTPYTAVIHKDGSITAQHEHQCYRMVAVGSNCHKVYDFSSSHLDAPANGETIEMWMAGGMIRIKKEK